MEWIDIEENQPKEKELILACDLRLADYQIYEGYFDNEYFQNWALNYANMYIKPTHWMPKPEPPNAH